MMFPRHLKNLAAVAVLALTLLVLFVSRTQAAVPLTQGSGHIKYYGFYGQGYTTNYLVSGSANVAFADILFDVDKNAEFGLSSVYFAQHIFFYDDTWPNAAVHVPLRTDAQSRWNTFASQMSSRVNNGSIIGFYLYGEPYSNRAALGLPKSQTYSELQSAAQMIKQTFPNAVVMVVEQYYYLEPTILNSTGKLTLFPPEIDWVGFDCYEATYETCGGKGIPFYFNQLKSGLQSNQKIVLVPQVAAITEKPTTADQDYIINLNQKYLSLAENSPEVVAIFGWIADKYYDGGPIWGGLMSDWDGLENYRVRDSLLQNGRILLGRQSASLAVDAQRVTDKNRIISALQNYYREHGQWPASASGAWSCLSSTAETCWKGSYQGLDQLTESLAVYLGAAPTINAVPENYAHNRYLYASNLPANNLKVGSPSGAYLIWAQENTIPNPSQCTNVAHPDKYWYCYELIPIPTVTPPPVPPPAPVPPPPSTNTLPVGNFDEIRTSDGLFRGWGLDLDAKATSLETHIYIDSAAGAGKTPVASFKTSILRSDVNSLHGATGNHGFEWIIPAQYYDNQTHTAYVYVVDANDGTKSFLLTGSPKTFKIATPINPVPVPPPPPVLPPTLPAPPPVPVPPPPSPQPAATDYPDGIFFKYLNDPTVYVKESGLARPITDWTVYQNQVPGSRSIVTIPSTVVFPVGPTLGLRSGTLIKAVNNSTVYLIVNGKKYAFPSAEEFHTLSYRFDNVYVINDVNVVNAIELNTEPFIRPFGTLFKYSNSPTVYFLNSARQKRGFTSIQMYSIWSATLKDVITIPVSEQYPDGQPVDFPNGIVVRGSAATIYLVENGNLRPFNDLDKFYNMGFKQTDVKVFPDSDLFRHPIGNPV